MKLEELNNKIDEGFFSKKMGSSQIESDYNGEQKANNATSSLKSTSSKGAWSSLKGIEIKDASDQQKKNVDSFKKELKQKISELSKNKSSDGSSFITSSDISDMFNKSKFRYFDSPYFFIFFDYYDSIIKNNLSKEYSSFKTVFNVLIETRNFTRTKQKLLFSKKYEENILDNWKKMIKSLVNSGINYDKFDNSLDGFSKFCSALNYKLYELALDIANKLKTIIIKNDKTLTSFAQTCTVFLIQKLNANKPNKPSSKTPKEDIKNKEEIADEVLNQDKPKEDLPSEDAPAESEEDVKFDNVWDKWAPAIDNILNRSKDALQIRLRESKFDLKINKLANKYLNENLVESNSDYGSETVLMAYKYLSSVGKKSVMKQFFKSTSLKNLDPLVAMKTFSEKLFSFDVTSFETFKRLVSEKRKEEIEGLKGTKPGENKKPVVSEKEVLEKIEKDFYSILGEANFNSINSLLMKNKENQGLEKFLKEKPLPFTYTISSPDFNTQSLFVVLSKVNEAFSSLKPEGYEVPTKALNKILPILFNNTKNIEVMNKFIENIKSKIINTGVEKSPINSLTFFNLMQLISIISS